ncbi:MAG TPA: metal-dependent hydrolase [Bacteriovoracaceae bacterium]|nr:metal-dependent hydrolase [Bacteriovoracaceae bacterium]
MASLFTHAIIPVALQLSKVGPFFSRRLLLLCVVLSIFPDFDVIAFRFEIPYESQWGHRGFTHSIFLALLVALLCQGKYRRLRSDRKTVFLATFFSTSSHIALDALTNGGLGVAAGWPFDHGRYFFPWTPIEVSPIGVANFFGQRGLVVILSELAWVWLPALVVALLLRAFRPLIPETQAKE